MGSLVVLSEIRIQPGSSVLLLHSCGNKRQRTFIIFLSLNSKGETHPPLANRVSCLSNKWNERDLWRKGGQRALLVIQLASGLHRQGSWSRQRVECISHYWSRASFKRKGKDSLRIPQAKETPKVHDAKGKGVARPYEMSGSSPNSLKIFFKI